MPSRIELNFQKKPSEKHFHPLVVSKTKMNFHKLPAVNTSVYLSWAFYQYFLAFSLLIYTPKQRPDFMKSLSAVAITLPLPTEARSPFMDKEHLRMKSHAKPPELCVMKLFLKN